MKQQVQYVECPRDAMQGWPLQISTAQKAQYLQQLLELEVEVLDAVSFVNPKLVPQMADSLEVLSLIDTTRSKTKLLAVAANLRGVETACSQQKISMVGYPFSLSETFQMRNANKTIEESIPVLLNIHRHCRDAGKELIVYLSMAFGNPYGDTFNTALVAHYVEWMYNEGMVNIVLSDTVGVASADEVFAICNSVVQRHPEVRVGAHLHCRPEAWQSKLDAALKAGCVRIDGAINGVGGCPMAGDHLVGNLNSALALPYLVEHGYRSGVNNNALNRCVEMANSLFN